MLPRDPFTLAALAAHLSRLGKYFPNQYTPPKPSDIHRPDGKYNPGGFQDRGHKKPAGGYNKGAFQEVKLEKPTGAYRLHGEFKDAKPKEIVDFDPWGTYYFSFELDKVEVARFMECSGLKNAAEIFEIEEGGKNDTVHKRPGYTKWDNIVLKKALWKGHLFAEWRDYYMQPRDDKGKPQDAYKRLNETTAAIVMRHNDGTELRRYTILKPWPISWEGPSLSSGGSDLALETLEIAHEGIQTPLPGNEVEIPEKPPEEKELDFENPKFANDSSELNDEEGKKVDDAAEVLAEKETKEIWVEGHCSREQPTQAKYDYNMTLSYERALTVAKRLTSQNPNLTAYVTGFSWRWPEALKDPWPRDGVKNEFGGNRRTDVFETNKRGDPNRAIAGEPDLASEAGVHGTHPQATVKNGGVV